MSTRRRSAERAAGVTRAALTALYAPLTAEDFTPKARSAVAWLPGEGRKKEDGPDGAVFLRSVFDLEANGGEGGQKVELARTWRRIGKLHAKRYG